MMGFGIMKKYHDPYHDDKQARHHADESHREHLISSSRHMNHGRNPMRRFVFCGCLSIL